MRSTHTLIFLLLFPALGISQTNYHFLIKNDFDQPLIFKATINAEVLKNLPTSLPQGESAEVVLVASDEVTKQAYIRTEDQNNAKNSAFWGIGIEKQHIQFHGYISKKIAFSWKSNVIIFCTPEAYKSKHAC